MCFKPKCMNTFTVPDLFIDGALLDRVSTCKYLGLIIDEQYCDNEDIQMQPDVFMPEVICSLRNSLFVLMMLRHAFLNHSVAHSIVVNCGVLIIQLVLESYNPVIIISFLAFLKLTCNVAFHMSVLNLILTV